MLKETTTSLEIKLVDMLCECSWYVLNILMVLFIMALKQKRYQRPTEKVFKVIPFQTCWPIQYFGLVSQRIDQLAVTLRQRGVPAPLLKIDLNAFYNASALVMDKKFIMFLFTNLASPFTVLSTSPTMIVSRAYQVRDINEVN